MGGERCGMKRDRGRERGKRRGEGVKGEDKLKGR